MDYSFKHSNDLLDELLKVEFLKVFERYSQSDYDVRR
ncbi:hypothetical protein Bhyg_13560 [Pseudolycoriella hygida]|uniref:Uncharacterized protein n=1 Tax=Pseudolycoriella hygida TaxID=35572 RepID=A0A9Q0RWK8_9DIPT|nr:hypothetical protein Bhyg_13560 [Pseudolycoriella hygida]